MRAWTPVIEPGPIIVAICLLFAFTSLTDAAPTASEHDLEHSTEIEYYPVADATGCYYNFQHYDEGDRIITNEPCLNCTCHNRMLMCYLRVCPFTKAIGANCKVEKRPDQCCPVITCPEVPVHLVTSTAPSTALGHLNEYGCTIEGLFYSDGARVPSNPENPCELCYCIRNKTACVMQECTLKVEGCVPVFQEGVCCPVRYNCDHPEYIEGPTTPQITTTSTTTTTTTTTLAPTTTLQPLECVYNSDSYADGEIVKKDLPCEKCYCMRGHIVCAVQECSPTPLDKVNCTALPVREGQCCPDSYDCAGVSEEDLTTISYDADAVTTEASIPKETEVPAVELTTSQVEEEQTTEAKIAELPVTIASVEPEQPEVVEQITSKAIETPQPTEEATESVAEDTSKPSLEEASGGAQEVTDRVQETLTPVIDQETTIISEMEIATTGKVEEVTDAVQPEEETKAQTTEAPVETFTSRITAAVETVTSRITETVEVVTTAITGIYTQKPETELTEVSKESETHTPSTTLEPEISDKTGVTPAISEKEKPATDEKEEDLHEGSGLEPETEKPEDIVTEKPLSYDIIKEGEHKVSSDVSEEDKTEKSLTEAVSADEIGVVEESTLKSIEPIESTEKVPVEHETHEPSKTEEQATEEVKPIDIAVSQITEESIGATESSDEVKPVDEKVTEITEVAEDVTESGEEIKPTDEKVQEITEASIPKQSEASEKTIVTEEIVTAATEQVKHAGDEPTTASIESKPPGETIEESKITTSPHEPETNVPEESITESEQTSTLQPDEESKIPEKPQVTESVEISSHKEINPTEEEVTEKEVSTSGIKESHPSEEQVPVTEAGIVAEKCDQHGCVQASNESVPEKTEGATSEEEHVSHVTQSSTVVKSDTEKTSEIETATTVAIKDISTEREEVEIVTEIPAKKTELPEAMDHVSETAQSTEAPKSSTSSTSKEPGAAISESEQDHTEGVVKEIATESPKQTVTIKDDHAEPQAPEKPTEANAEKESKPEEATEIPTVEENEIEPERATPHEKIPAIAEKEETTTAFSEIEHKEKIPEYIPVTEKAIIPEVCTSETECAHPTVQLPVVPPTVVTSTGSEKPDVFDTPESTTIREEQTESTDESNKIPDSGIDETVTVTQRPEIVSATTTVSVEQEHSADEKISKEPIETATSEPKLTHTTEFVSETSTEISGEQTELPREIPGEGSCLVDGKTYKNNSSVPPINHCQVACKCVSSILRCKSIDCPSPPEDATNCIIIKPTQKGCCPTYSCTGSEVTSPMESDSHIVDTTTQKSEAETTQKVETTKATEVSEVPESTRPSEESKTESPILESTKSQPSDESERTKGTKAEEGEQEIDNEIPKEVTVTSKPIETPVSAEEEQTVTSESGVHDLKDAHELPSATEEMIKVVTTTEVTKTEEVPKTDFPIVFSAGSQTQVPEVPITDKQPVDQSESTELPEIVTHTEEEPAKITTEYQTEKQPEQASDTNEVEDTESEVEHKHDKLTTPEPSVVHEDAESVTKKEEIPEKSIDNGEIFTTQKSLIEEATTEYQEEEKIKPTESEEVEANTSVAPTIKEHHEVPTVSQIPEKEYPVESRPTSKPEIEESIITELATENETEIAKGTISPTEEEKPIDTDKTEHGTAAPISEIDKVTPPKVAIPAGQDEDKEHAVETEEGKITEISTEKEQVPETTPYEEVTKAEGEIEQELYTTELSLQEPKATEVPKGDEIITEAVPSVTILPEQQGEEVEITESPVTDQPVKSEEPNAATIHPEIAQPELTTIAEEISPEKIGDQGKTEQQEKTPEEKVTEKIPAISEQTSISSSEAATQQPVETLTTLSPELEESFPKATEQGKVEVTEIPVEEVTLTKSEEEQKTEIPAVPQQPAEEEQKTEIPAVPQQPSEEEQKAEIPAGPQQPGEEEQKMEIPTVPQQPSEEEQKTEIPVVPQEPVEEEQNTEIPAVPQQPTEGEQKTEIPVVPQEPAEEEQKTEIPVVTQQPTEEEQKTEIPVVPQEPAEEEQKIEVPVVTQQPTEEEQKTEIPAVSQQSAEEEVTTEIISAGTPEVQTESELQKSSTILPIEKSPSPVPIDVKIGSQPDLVEQQTTLRPAGEESVSDRNEPEISSSQTPISETTDISKIPAEKVTTIASAVEDERKTERIDSESHVTEKAPHVDEYVTSTEERIQEVTQAVGEEVSATASSIGAVTTIKTKEATEVLSTEFAEPSKPSATTDLSKPTVEESTSPGTSEGITKQTQEQITTETPVLLTSKKTEFEPEVTESAAVTEIVTEKSTDLPSIETEKPQVSIEKEPEVSEKETEIPPVEEQTEVPEVPTTGIFKSTEEPKPIEPETGAPQFEKGENDTDLGLKATEIPEVELTVTEQQPIVTEIVTEKSVVTQTIITEIPKEVVGTNKSVDELGQVPQIDITSPIVPTVITVKEEQLNVSETGSLFTSPVEASSPASTPKAIPGELSTSAPVTTQSAITSEQPTARPQIPGESVSQHPDDHEEPDETEEEPEEPEEPDDISEPGEESNAFGPGTCRYGGKVYVSAQQIPRDDPCDFCFCFRSDIICLQQSCPPPIPRCHEEPIRGFCCPRYECPVSTATTINVTTSTTTTTTTLPPHFLSHAYKGRASKSGCQIQGKAYKVGEVIRATSGPCLHCTCGGDGHMKCDPKPCSPEPMLRQMIAAAASRRRR